MTQKSMEHTIENALTKNKQKKFYNENERR